MNYLHIYVLCVLALFIVVPRDALDIQEEDK